MRTTACATIAQKAIAYGFDGLQLDGNDALAVYVGVKDAVDRAKKGGGPSLIEAVTYRMSVHTTADDPTKYRSEEEVKKWEKLDPIARYQKYLVKRKVLDDKLIAEIEKDILADVVASRPRPSGRTVESDAVAERATQRQSSEVSTLAVDPVCGMTVAAVDASLHLDHDGRRWWFCGSGCLRAFAAAPETYVR